MHPAFLPVKARRRNSTEGYPIFALLGLQQTDGQIGIEIEVEGNKFPTGPCSSSPYPNIDSHLIPKQWKYTHDGSLRGDMNAEYVLAKPLMFDEVPKAINDLWSMFNDYGSVLDESNRTSVHVHLNVQEFHLNRLAAFCGMYFAIEDLLTHWCGEHRVGNLFCLRAKDAPAIVTHLKEFIRNDGKHAFPNGLHYGGLNPGAIVKFGSVEIRALRGVADPKVILDWVSILQRLYELSAEFPDPRAVVGGFSGEGPLAWLERILGDKCGLILNECPYSTDEIRNSLYEGIRLAQDLCFCREWSEYTPKVIERDPFGRTEASDKAVGYASMSETELINEFFNSPYCNVMSFNAWKNMVLTKEADAAPSPTTTFGLSASAFQAHWADVMSNTEPAHEDDDEEYEPEIDWDDTDDE